MSVYFITCREIGMVKIGCAYDPFRRMRTLQTAFPLELALEALFVGAYREEREYHKRFAEHRVRGEWFKLCPEIAALIGTTTPPCRPLSVAQKRRLFAMHQDTRWTESKREEADRKRKEAARVLASADIYFPFRESVEA
jgi:hypothetical protein